MLLMLPLSTILFLHDFMGGAGAFLASIGAIGVAVLSVANQFSDAKPSVAGFLNGASSKSRVAFVIGGGLAGVGMLLDTHFRLYDRHTRLLQTGNAFNALAELSDLDAQEYAGHRLKVMEHSIGFIPDKFHDYGKYKVLTKMARQLNKLDTYGELSYVAFRMKYRWRPKSWRDDSWERELKQSVGLIKQ